ncbi:ceramide kinase-like isoform X1 [Polyodon spathula]|uniref:ceramide kinase-like isoform X1 n=1 Tax=Polyodon spathula TaxID=7913 RepID=UPI001B7EB113|nr:ceramide kinase-like isoform X1 [Polyodon spathula]
MEKQPSVLTSLLLVKSRLFEVTLNRTLLTWKEVQLRRKKVSGNISNRLRFGFCLANALHRTRGLGAGVNSVPVSEIIAVREAEVDKRTKDEGKLQKMTHITFETHLCAFTVSYVEKTGQHRWRCSNMTFCSDETICQQWVQTLKEQLSLLTCRPKHLLVYINPYGGKQQGKQIYEHKVAQLFTLASIATDVIVTEHANHARDHLKTQADLRKYDGIVCVGGDGMFSEIIHGLIARTQSDSGVDLNDSQAKLAQCNLRIGIIPAGSTDCICYATVGVNDPVTSALHIIVGDSQPMDVCSVHHHNTFLKYSVSLLGYGFYGDVLKDSERNRWMGPVRYDFSGFKTFLSHHYYEGTISFLPAANTLGSPRDSSRCRSGCYVCQNRVKDISPVKWGGGDVNENEFEGEWKVINGKFLAINAASMSCACPRSPKGLSPAAHLADGTTDIILVRKCSRLNFLRHLLRHTSKDDQFDLTFVEVYRVKKFKFTPKQCDSEFSDIREVRENAFGQICRDHPSCDCPPVNSNWNCDGEILEHAAIEVGVHWQLIKLFARGIEENPPFEEDVSPSAI